MKNFTRFHELLSNRCYVSKKQLLILLSLFISVVGYSQMVGDTFVDNFTTYEITSLSPNEVEIISYDANGGTVVNIPQAVTNSSTSFSVKSIGTSAYNGRGLTSVTIPDTVTIINIGAFLQNSLTSITIPDSVTFIGNLSFKSNQITSVIIPSGAVAGFESFKDNALTNVSFEDGVTSINPNAFENNQITNITIPSSVTFIGSLAFAGNPLTSVTSESLTPPIITTGSVDSFNTDRSGIDLTIPNGTSAAYVAGGWTGFNSVTEAAPLAVGDTFVDNFITYEITSLLPDEVKTIDYDTAGGTIVNIPATVNLNNVSYGVTEIGGLSFEINNLTDITIPNSVSSIGGFAFSGNPNLSTVNIPAGVISIGSHAFFNCGLTSATIPDGVTTIGFSAFSQNNTLSSIVLPNSITSIGANAFNICGLTNVNIPTGMTTIEDGTFANNNLTSITIPNNITSIGQFAFRFNNINNLVIPDSVLEIEDLAFNSNSITNLDLGNGVQIIGNDAFRFNQMLQVVTIPASVTDIGDGAFASPALTDVYSEATIPANITTSASPNDTFAIDRSTVHLHIPPGTMDVYVSNPGALWIAFNPVTEDALSIDDFELSNNIKVITTADQIQVVSPDSVRLENYTIYSISGAKVSTGKNTQISTVSFSKGIYVLKLEFDKGTTIKKIAIK